MPGIFFRSRSWPAFTPSPIFRARRAASRCAARISLPSGVPNACAYGAGVQLDSIRTEFSRARDLLGISIEEQTRANARLLEPREQVAEPISVAARQVPSCIRGQHAGRVGHERHLSRPHAQNQVDKLRAGVTLDIELDRQHRGEIEDVLKRDMPRVGPRMHRYPVTSGRDTRTRRLDDVRNIPAARIPERRNFVDVDAEPNHSAPTLPEHPRAFTASLCLRFSFPLWEGVRVRSLALTSMRRTSS